MWWWDLDWYRDWEWNWTPGATASVVIGLFIGLAVWIVVEFFFLRNLRDLLLQVHVENRAMRPGRVWLNFVPVFSFGWMIYTVVKTRKSVLREFWARGWLTKGDVGFGMGMAYAVLVFVSWIMDWFPTSSVSLMAELVGVGGFICWIIYWVKTSNLKHLLIMQSERSEDRSGHGSPRSSDDEDYEGDDDEDVYPDGGGEDEADDDGGESEADDDGGGNGHVGDDGGDDFDGRYRGGG